MHVCDAISVVTQIERFTARSGPAKDERRVEVRVTLIYETIKMVGGLFTDMVIRSRS